MKGPQNVARSGPGMFPRFSLVQYVGTPSMWWSAAKQDHIEGIAEEGS
jgi:hypothetical protein